MTRWLLVLCIALAAAGCKKSRDNVVARLEKMTAQVERMPKQAAPWGPARVGDTFVLGSAVRTGEASTANLRVGKRGKLDVKASSVVYFTRTPGRERNDVRVETGIVELESGESPIGIGDAVLEAGGQATLEHDADGTRIVVKLGRVVLEDNVFEAGQSFVIGKAGRVAAAQARDAGVGASRAGDVHAVVKDKAAQAKTSSGERELPVGEHDLANDTTLSTHGAVELTGAAGHVRTTGEGELTVGDRMYQLVSGRFGLRALEAGAAATVPGAKLTSAAGGDVLLDVNAKQTTVDVIGGNLAVESANGTQTIEAGRSATITAAGDVKLLPPPPARTVVVVAAGESPVIHDPRAPAPIRFAFGSCSGGVLEVAKDRAFKSLVARASGTASASALVPAGSFSYRVRCSDGTTTSGTVRVDRETGRAPLPKTAARTTVEMDGREYTILYQNLLPEVTLAWRKAPSKPSYTFVIKPAKGGEKRLSATNATLKLPAGDLREGSYKTWVEPAGGSRSEESRIVIDFDNAAASASIELVEARDKALRIKGMAIDGSTVTANGTAISLDRHRRFDTELARGANEDGVGVRIAHPQAGIHYYVMRP